MLEKIFKIIACSCRFLLLGVSSFIAFSNENSFQNPPDDPTLYFKIGHWIYEGEHRFWLAVPLIIIWILSEIISFICFKLNKKKRIKSLLKVAMDRCFSGDFTNFRITLYLKRNCFLAFWTFLRRSIFKICSRHITKYHWSQIPFNPLNFCLAFYARHGKPYQKGTSTTFKVLQENNNDKKVNGVVEKCFYTENSIAVENLPDLSYENIKIYKNIENIENNLLKENIEIYMKKSFFNSFDKLKCLHRYPKQLHAFPIASERKNHKICGVLVIDSISEEPIATHIDELILVNKILSWEI